MNATGGPYDAVLLLSFGGPEGPDDVVPFLENVLRGRNVPRERLLEVAQHYHHFGGVSPINSQNRELLAALRRELPFRGIDLPVFWGNRNWHPLLPDTLRDMRDQGVRRALAFVTSAFSSYSGCRQYLQDIVQARDSLGPGAPTVDKIRVFFNHPVFIDVVADCVRAAVAEIAAERRASAVLVYTAHSIPCAMANSCAYESQLLESARLVSARVDRRLWKLVYQSRSGPPSQPWLEPDICDYLRTLSAETSPRDVVVVPIGFLSDHMEVLYDLDTEAQAVSATLGVNLIRAGTAGSHPRFVELVCELIAERMAERLERPAIGSHPPWPDVCPLDCCPPPPGPVSRTPSASSLA